MQDSLLLKNRQKNITLYDFSIDWPYEQACLHAKVVSVQTQNIFRWVVLRIFEDFKGNPPSLEEAALQLGIKDHVFLKETLDTLISEGMIEKTDSRKNVNFANCRIINRPATQPQPFEPELHSFNLLFDVATGEYAPPFADGKSENPDNPVLTPDNLAATREIIGLEMARNYAKSQQEPFLTAQSSIVDVKVDPLLSLIVWKALKGSITIDETGTVQCNLGSATIKQQAWFAALGFEHKIFGKILKSNIDRRYYPVINSSIPFKKWQSHCENQVSPDALMDKAAELINKSHQEILIDAYFVNFVPVKQALLQAIKKGVAIRVCGRKSQLPDVPEFILSSAEIIELGDYPRIVLICDDSSAISIDQVEVATPQNKNLKIIAMSYLKPCCALELRHELLSRNIHKIGKEKS
ncbi:MAG: hypothetical protein ACYC54_12970 [Sedimentisphaerales bacterium]